MSRGGRAALLAIAFLGLGSMVYFLYRRIEQDGTDDNYLTLTAGKRNVVQVKVPKESIGLIIGRGGSKLKELEELTDTKISFKEMDSDTHKLCFIRGNDESVQMAEQLIYEIIVNQPLIQNYEMYVPKEACGRIIGRNGENIKSISRSSNAKIILHNTKLSKDKELECKILIKGTLEQIEYAKLLVEQKVEEDKALRSMIQSSLASRSPRHKAKYLLPGPDEAETSEASTHKETLIATGSDGLLEVYVSALRNPENFWVQIVGPLTVALDRLNEQMTDYYSKEENRQLHILKEVVVDQIVAAPFSYDNKWYRAEISEIIENEYDSAESELRLYYVDYGDSAVWKRNEVYELRTDFLRLRFQAIECILAKVKPRGTWSEEAIDLFEKLTYTGLWKSLMAKVHGYRARPTRAKREGSPVPCIELYDSQETKTVNVGEELVKMNFADWDEETTSQNNLSVK